MPDTPTYKSTLTGPEVDAALKNIAQYQELLVQAKEYSEQAKQYADSINPSQFAPTNHANSGTKYGIGTATLFGHVKLSDSAGDSGSTSGVAATPKSVQEALKTLPVINAGITNISPLNPGQEISYQVTFKAPMPDTNYAVVLGLSYGGAYWANICFLCTSKSTNGFTFSARNDVGMAQTSAATIDWIAVHQ